MNSGWLPILRLLPMTRLTSSVVQRTGIKVDFCPEGPPASLCEALRAGTIGLSLGFQPQVSIKCVSRPERAADAFPQVMGRRQTNKGTKNLAPLQGASWLGIFLGLKPQAESYSPFGTKISIQPKYLSTKSQPHHHHSAWPDSRTRTTTSTSTNPLSYANRNLRFDPSVRNG
jgi:hypothetical protein